MPLVCYSPFASCAVEAESLEVSVPDRAPTERVMTWASQAEPSQDLIPELHLQELEFPKPARLQLPLLVLLEAGSAAVLVALEGPLQTTRRSGKPHPFARPCSAVNRRHP